jgi:TBC1 domain family member 20
VYDENIEYMTFEDKRQVLCEILLQDPVDCDILKEFSRKEGGFLSNKIRARVWPKLLGVNRYNVIDYNQFIKPHHDERQIRVDIDRSFWSLDCAKSWGERRMNRKRRDLSNIITAVLCRNEPYFYFQGFHDIVSILILVFNDNALAFGALEAMCERYLVDFMKSDFSSLSKIMKLIMVLIKQADETLADFLEKSSTEPFFATSWLITWMSHDLSMNFHFYVILYINLYV